MLQTISPSPVRLTDLPLATAAVDYDVVRRAIAYISEHWRAQPEIEAIAAAAGVSSSELHHLFRRWAGLSGPGRLHDLFVTHEAMSPGEWKAGGEGLAIRYGFHPSPFGMALVMTTPRGLCGLAFADAGKQKAALADMRSRWPKADYIEDAAATAPLAQRIFDPKLWRPERPLRVVLIGTDWEIRVWETLLAIPMGRAATYSDIAAKVCTAKAARAVGAAVGKNPVCFVVPCHRVIGKDGKLTGYHWGLTRKRAMLGWEAGQVAA